MKKISILSLIAITALAACKKEGCTDENAENYNSKAKKNDGSCVYLEPAYTVPTTYSFVDDSGASTVDYSGQTTRLNQLREMVLYMKTGISVNLNAQQLKDMFANTNGNGNGAFSFTSTKQLKDKCFALDQAMYEDFMDSIAQASLSFSSAASSGQAGVLTNFDAKTYLFNRNGVEYAQVIQKGLMGAVLMNQALNSYFSGAKMNVDNATLVSGTNYTLMQHHWDEAFGYLGVDPSFPSVLADDFWGDYCNEHNATLNSNTVLMSNFLKGRAAIVNNKLTDRDLAIKEIRVMWEKLAAYSAMGEIDEAIVAYNEGDQAAFLHLASEAYGFILCLRYAPLETRKMSNTEVDAILAKFGTNFWNISLIKLNEIKADIDAKY